MEQKMRHKANQIEVTEGSAFSIYIVKNTTA